MSQKNSNNQCISNVQLGFLVILRLAIGWHFLYEGLAKLFTPDWSSAPYLEMSRWIFSDFFHWIASHPDVLNMVDRLNIWGLIFIGLGLILGSFTRIASIAGAILLFLYYICNPPLVGLDVGIPTEGNYLIIDKNIVELFALAVLIVFPTGRSFGLDRLMMRKRLKKHQSPENEKQSSISTESTLSDSLNRREILKSLVPLPFLGGFFLAFLKKRGWESYEEKYLEEYVDSTTSATIKRFEFSKLNLKSWRQVRSIPMKAFGMHLKPGLISSVSGCTIFKLWMM